MKILCLGEVLIDMLSAGAADQSEMPAMNSFQPYAGGAPANVAVAVAKLGGQGAMVSKVGDDTFGRFLQDMLSYHKCFLGRMTLDMVSASASWFASIFSKRCTTVLLLNFAVLASSVNHNFSRPPKRPKSPLMRAISLTCSASTTPDTSYP